MFTQPFIQMQIKEYIKAPRHWPLCGEFHQRPVKSRHKWPVARKMFPFDDVIMSTIWFKCQRVAVVSDNGLAPMATGHWLFPKITRVLIEYAQPLLPESWELWFSDRVIPYMNATVVQRPLRLSQHAQIINAISITKCSPTLYCDWCHTAHTWHKRMVLQCSVNRQHIVFINMGSLKI